MHVDCLECGAFLGTALEVPTPSGRGRGGPAQPSGGSTGSGALQRTGAGAEGELEAHMGGGP
eukprot:11781836-Alexandrium_andersonii.AAC.1